MEKYTGSFNKYNLHSNKLKMKSILSIFTMGIFIFFGFASIDEGDPETRVLDDCEFLPSPINVMHNCSFKILDEKGNALKNQSINFTIKGYQKVGNSTTCSLVQKTLVKKTLDFGSSETASLILSKTYFSNDDLIELYFKILVLDYNTYTYTLNLHKGDVSVNYNIRLLKLNKFP